MRIEFVEYSELEHTEQSGCAYAIRELKKMGLIIIGIKEVVRVQSNSSIMRVYVEIK